MQIFGKEINTKDYDCSFNPNEFERKTLPFKLYIQAQNNCNAKCDFCDPGCINQDFDFQKLDVVLNELSRRGILAGVSITGGEPLLNVERVINIIKLVKKYVCRVSLNTNAYSIERLLQVYGMLDNIYISRHHYNNDINDSIMKIKTPTIDELSEIDSDGKITMHCVLQKGYIDCATQMKLYMDYLGNTNIRKVKFISLYPLTSQAKEKMIDVDTLLNEFKTYTNAGILYDKCFCCCLDFVYVTNQGRVVNAILRNNKTNHFDCCKQLVYNGTNLYDGFEKNIKII